MKQPLMIIGVCLLVLGAGCSNLGTGAADVSPQGTSQNDYSKLTTTGIQGSQSANETSVTSSESESESPNDEKPVIDTSNLSFPGVLPKEETTKLVRIKTNKGEIVFELLPDEAPNAASNFVYLVSHQYYDGLTFHRYVPNFVIQGGDPTGTGAGGPGYKFEDDPVRPAEENPYMEMRGGAYTYLKGTVAMANAGPNTNGSQFFIMNADAPMVGPDYSIFGHVIEGIDVVEQLRQGDVMERVTLEDK